MPDFVDRQRELRELNELLNVRKGQLAIVYGRRRVGKTTLLLHWVQQINSPYIYWVARRETAEATRQSFARALWRWAYPDTDTAEPPRFESWSLLFEQMARMIGNQPLILICDEFPYAVESDSSLPSHLQAAWDHLLKSKPVMVILAGSHIGMMVDLFDYQAPLYGRFTSQLLVEPLPFAALTEFFPKYSAAERVAAYAVLGGIPAYLEWFDPQRSLGANIRHNLFRRVGMFRSEPLSLIGDLVRETRTYEAALRAVASGAHTPADIASQIGLPSSNLAPYLKRLRELGLIERRIPATVPPNQRRSTTRSRYYLRDSYLRFYFRFIEPNLEMVELELTDVLWERISEQFRAFIGGTVFEELCREWVTTQARLGKLPFVPELVGSHWAPDAQVDVVAINWRDKAILLGECKWGLDSIGRAVVLELLDKTPQVVPGPDWQVHYALFARTGFSDAARAEIEKAKASMLLVNLETLDADLRKALERV